MLAEIIAIGDELTSGQRLDTNSQWLSRELGLLGIPVGYHTTACDTLAAGVHAFSVQCTTASLTCLEVRSQGRGGKSSGLIASPPPPCNTEGASTGGNSETTPTPS